MHIAFEKLGKYHCYIWLAILLDITASMVVGFLKKFYNVISVVSRDDIFELLEKHLGETKIIELISRYAGVGFGVLLIFYLLVLFIYIIIAFGIPNLVYIITKVAIRTSTIKFKRFIGWAVCFLSFIPGIWCTTKLVVFFTLLVSVNITLLHLLALFLIQAEMILLYIIAAFKSVFINDEVKISV